MGSNTGAIIVFLIAMGAWMWWRTSRLPAPAAQPAALGAETDAADANDVICDLDLLRHIPAEYAGRDDLQRVVLVNDDTTPMEVVTVILEKVFELPIKLAFPAMFESHEQGECVIRVLPAELAAERIAAAREIAESSGGYPLRIIARPLPDGPDQVA